MHPQGKPIVTDADLANHLLSTANVVALPGSEVRAREPAARAGGRRGEKSSCCATESDRNS